MLYLQLVLTFFLLCFYSFILISNHAAATITDLACIFSAFLSSLFLLYLNCKTKYGFIVKMLFMLLLLIPFAFDAVYFLNEDKHIDQTTIFLILQTNPDEAIRFIRHYPPFLLFVLLLFLFMYLFSKISLRSGKRKTGLTAGFVICFSFFAVSAYFSSFKISFNEAEKKLAELRENREIDLKTLVAGKKTAEPHTHFVVIGESSCRDYWSLYGYDKPTTPAMQDIFTASKHNVFLKNAWSAEKMTEFALAQALTQANQYNLLPFRKAYSIIDVLNKAGFETYWISNQPLHHNENASFNSVARAAKYRYYINMNNVQYFDQSPLDETVVEKLSSISFDNTKDNVVFIHLIGNHSPYQDRYKPETAYFNTKGKDNNPLNHYLNSLRYSDYILRKLFKYAQENHADTFTYFSDHGELPGVGRDHFNTEMFKIPVLIYSKRITPEFKQLLRNNEKNIPFTNDLIFDTLLGLFEIKSDIYESKYDYSSPDFILKKQAAFVFSGKKVINAEGEIIDRVMSVTPAVKYTANNNIDLLLTKGWSQTEGWGIWSLANESEIKFNTDTPVSKISIFLRPFLCGARKKSCFQITVNRKTEKQVCLNKDTLMEYHLKPATDKIKISFSHTNPQSPEELGCSTDSRKLNIGIMSLRVE